MEIDKTVISKLINKDHLNKILGKRINIISPINYLNQTDLDRQLFRLFDSGFLKIRVNGKINELIDSLKIDSSKNYVIEVVVDRMILEASEKSIKRYKESLEIALRVGNNNLLVIDNDTNEVIFNRLIPHINSLNEVGIKNFAPDKKVNWIDRELGIILKNKELYYYDSRDGKEYPLFINQHSIWFAKNLAFKATDSIISDDGILYSNIEVNKDYFLPSGWLLPTIADWNFLSYSVSKSSHPLYKRHAILDDGNLATPYSIVSSLGLFSTQFSFKIGRVFQVIDVNESNNISLYDLDNDCIVEEEGSIGGKPHYFDPSRFELVLNWSPGLFNPPCKSSSVRDLNSLRFGQPQLENFGLNSTTNFFYIDGGFNNCLKILRNEDNRISKVNSGLPIRCFTPLNRDLLYKINKSSYKFSFDIEESFFEEFSVQSFRVLKKNQFIYSQYFKKYGKNYNELLRLINTGNDLPI